MIQFILRRMIHPPMAPQADPMLPPCRTSCWPKIRMLITFAALKNSDRF